MFQINLQLQVTWTTMVLHIACVKVMKDVQMPIHDRIYVPWKPNEENYEEIDSITPNTSRVNS